MPKSINKQISTATAIKPECHFFEVSGKMLCRDLMPRTKGTALEKRERGFNTVRGHIGVNVNFRAMIDRLVWNVFHSRLYCRARISGQIVGHNNFYILADVLSDVLCQCAFLRILGMKETQFAIPLLDSNDDLFEMRRFLPTAPSSFQASANVGFVHFDRSVK